MELRRRLTARLLGLYVAICALTLASSAILPPENVRISSVSMGLVLEWDHPRRSTHSHYTYTAERRGWLNYETECRNISSLSCDFTNNLSVFGVYSLRVRAELQGMASDWVETAAVTLDNITEISAPEVHLKSRDGEVDVNIIDPVLRLSDLRRVYRHISYTIHYWQEGKLEKWRQEAEQSRVALTELRPQERYCVVVEINIPKFNKTSQPSNVTCITNTASGKVEAWQIAVVLLVSFVGTALCVLLLFWCAWYCYRAARFLHPKAKLPEHFKQYLQDPPSSALFLAMKNSPQPEELFHEVNIVPETP